MQLSFFCKEEEIKSLFEPRFVVDYLAFLFTRANAAAVIIARVTIAIA